MKSHSSGDKFIQIIIRNYNILHPFEMDNIQVQELCRDFCTRYIACLRGKMQSENLLRSDYPLEHNNNFSNSNSPVNTPDHVSTLSITSDLLTNFHASQQQKLNGTHFVFRRV